MGKLTRGCATTRAAWTAALLGISLSVVLFFPAQAQAIEMTRALVSVKAESGVATASATHSARASDSPASAALVAQIAARLGQAKGIRTDFTQTRTLAAMKQPLVSTGSLVFFRDAGALWRIDTPYRATWIMRDSGMVEIDAEGHRVAGKGSQGARGAAEVSKMMRAMFSGDLSALYSQFDVQAQGTTSRWTLQLTPSQPQIAQVIRGLTISGGEFVQVLRIEFASGDATRFDFTDSAAVQALAPAELVLFGAP